MNYFTNGAPYAGWRATRASEREREIERWRERERSRGGEREREIERWRERERDREVERERERERERTTAEHERDLTRNIVES